MNLSSDKHFKRSYKEKSFTNTQECWKFFDCSKILCPAHGRSDTDCWLIPKTHGKKKKEKDFFQKISVCLECKYFKWRADQDSRELSGFLADQVQRYNFEALQQIYQKEESFIEIMNCIPDGLFTVNHELLITYFNPAAEKITGFTARDATGMYCKDVFKNTICETDCALKRALAEGVNIQNREYEITNIEGEQIPIICSTSVFSDAEGKIAGGIEIFKDITEIKKLHEEVATREKKYRRIFEGSHDMIYTSNLEGKILDVNQAGLEMLGYRTKKDLLSRGSAKELYLQASDRNEFVEKISQDGFVKDYEVDFKKRNGSLIHVLISSRRHENLDTGEIEFEGIIKDITKRKVAEKSLTQRNFELSILHKLALDLNSAMGLDETLKMALKNILKALKLESGALFLIDRETKNAQLRVMYGLPDQDKKHSDKVFFKDTPLMKFLLEGDNNLPLKSEFPPFQVSYRATKGESSPWLNCFLITSKGRCVGFIGLYLPSSRVLSSHEIHLLSSLGNFLGGAVENTQLMEMIRRHRQELRRLTEKLFQGQEEERRRIAHELHDEAGQALTGIKLALDRLEDNVLPNNGFFKREIEEISKMLAGTASEIRRLSHRLHPAVLSDLGLEPALDLYFREVSHHSGVDIEFHMVGFESRLEPGIETVLYRFAQEALNNTLKHSGAGNFHLSIIKSYPKIIFIAEDDGMGFDGEIRKADKMNLGLLGMRERSDLLGGTFQIRTGLGKGTLIRIEIPLM
ncbi:MAG: PAS domain S-box protein [Candidatus Hodarchaeales archaeon]